MNKYVEKVEKYKEKVLKPALEKIKAEHEEAEDFKRLLTSGGSTPAGRGTGTVK